MFSNKKNLLKTFSWGYHYNAKRRIEVCSIYIHTYSYIQATLYIIQFSKKKLHWEKGNLRKEKICSTRLGQVLSTSFLLPHCFSTLGGNLLASSLQSPPPPLPLPPPPVMQPLKFRTAGNRLLVLLFLLSLSRSMSFGGRK